MSNKKSNNLIDVRKCCLRKENLCGKTSTCELCSYMSNIKELWKSFCDVPIFDIHKNNSYGGCITKEWNNFPIGTHRANIVDWFYNTFEVDIYALKKLTGRDFNNGNR